MNKSIVLYLLLAGLLTCFSCTHTKQQPEEEGVDSEWLDSLQHVYQYGICIDSLDVTEYKMRNGDNPAAIFSALGFSALKADSITKASIHVLNPTKLRAGMNYYTFTTQDSVADIRYIAFAKSLVDYAVIDLTGDSILAYEFNKPITIKRHYTEGTINSSLWNVIKASGADPLLAIKISDVYAWQIDFFDVKEGDSFRVLYDVAYIDDTTALNITSIEGAVFTHQGKDFTAIPFTQDSFPEGSVGLLPHHIAFHERPLPSDPETLSGTSWSRLCGSRRNGSQEYRSGDRHRQRLYGRRRPYAESKT